MPRNLSYQSYFYVPPPPPPVIIPKNWFGDLVQAWVPPSPEDRLKRGAIYPWINIPNVYSLWRNFGWEVQPPQPPYSVPVRRGTILEGTDGIDRPFALFRNYGWHVQPWQPPAPIKRTERRGAILRGDDGNLGDFEFWLNSGWAQTFTQPPKPRPERSGAQFGGDLGIQFPLVAVLLTQNFPWDETPDVFPRKHFARAAAILEGIDSIDRPYTQWFEIGWPIQSWQPPHPFYEKRGAILEGDEGIQGTKTFGLQTNDFRWMETPRVDPRKNYERAGAILEGIDGIEAQYILWRNSGWEVQPWQPPARLPDRHNVGILEGIDAIDRPFELFRNYGWFIQSWQPPYSVPVRRGAILRGDDGIQGTKPFGLQTGDFRWMETPWVFPRKHWARAAAILEGIDAIDRPFELFRNYGWFVQPWQPPHPFREKRGAILEGDDGIQGIKPFGLQTNDFRWLETPLFQPPHPFREKRGAILEGIDAIEFPFVVALQTNDFRWMETPWVFPRKAFNKTGILEGIDGIDGRFQFFRNFGWVIQPWQPPHRRPERNAAIIRGIDGTEARFIPPLLTASFPWFATPLFQPPHGWWEKRGAFLIGHSGIEFLFNFVPPPPVRTVRTSFNRYAARNERDNTPDDVRNNRSSETRASGVVPRRFNTWRSDK